MAFPGTYNINYYKGDTLEFRVYPKDTSGAQFNLVGYTNANFTISNILGEPAAGGSEKVTINAYAEIDNSHEFILCTIRPIDGASLTANNTYVYDVEISKTSDPYDYVYTLLSGSIKVTEQVTQPAVIPTPNPATGVTIEDTQATSVTVSWTAPASGAPITGYKLYVLPNPSMPPDFGSAILVQTVASSVTSFTFTPLSPETTYAFGIVTYNSGGDGSPAGNFTTTLAV